MPARCLLLLVVIAPSLLAQANSEWMRYPAISPDGKQVVFAAQGDLWVVSAAGGVARALTAGDAHETRPVWSADGKSIAFASDRHGNHDVFVMPATGGTAKRLTFHSAADHPAAFGADGATVLFHSARGPGSASRRFPSGRQTETWAVHRASLELERIMDWSSARATREAESGDLFFERKPGIEDQWRKHHRSSAARDLWRWRPGSDQFVRLTDFAGEDREPCLGTHAGAPVLYFLSERAGTSNVFRMPRSGGEATQITKFERHPLRFLSQSKAETLCFGWHGEIWTQPAGEEPRRLAVQLARDAAEVEAENLSLSKGATEMQVSPDGKEVAFIVRGEVFVTATKGSETRRITNTPAQERWLSWAPDGRSLAYATERHGGWDIYCAKLVRAGDTHFFRAHAITEEALVKNPGDTFQPSYSPTGGALAFIEDRTALKVLDLETKAERTVQRAERNFSYADGDQHYEWSPDGKWLLTAFLQDGYWVGEIGVVPAAGGAEPVNLTQSGFSDFRPAWAPDLGAVVWFSNRDGMQSLANTGSREADVYATFLTPAAEDRFRLSKEEQEWHDESKKKASGEDEKPDKSGKDAAQKPIEIDFAGIAERRARLTIHSAPIADALVCDWGKKLVYLARFERGHDLWVTDLRSRETKVLVKLKAGGGSLYRAKKDNEVWLLSGGAIAKVDLKSGKRTSLSFRADLALDRKAERHAVFDHVRRTVRAKFYEPTLHGSAWNELCDAYAAKVDGITHDEDFAELLGELLGELNASHTGARLRRPAATGDRTADLGLLFDESFGGAGIRIAEVLKRGPFDRAASRARAGHLIESIDGVAQAEGPAGARPPVSQLLNRKAGKRVLVGLYDPATKERWSEQVRPISLAARNQLLYSRWVERQRALVEELSEGRFGYVHVRSMSDSSYRSVFEEALGRHVGKEALVIDTRFNGGGDLVDDLSRFLRGRPYMDFKTQDGRVIGGEPMRQWTRPSICVMSEGNYSDAHCFPFAFKELGIGKLVGTPVAGTCTFVWWERTQIPGLVYGIPNLGVRDMRGNYLENLQLEPDISVRPNEAQLSAGRDEQLEAAVRSLREELGTPK